MTTPRFACVMTVLFIALTAHAQTGPSLILKPWDDKQTVESQSSLRWFADGGDDHGNDVDLWQFKTDGRVRLSADKGAASLGWDVVHYDLSASDPLPKRLSDVQAAFGIGLGKQDDWEFALTVGIGYAGDTPFSDSDALYATGNLMGVYTLDENSSLTVGISYDGNRNIWPDVPLPLVAYHHRLSDQFSYRVSPFYFGVTWEPIEKLKIDATYILPISWRASITYDLTDQLQLFGTAENDADAFWIDSTGPRRRVFLRQQRVEAGLRWRLAQQVNLELAGGYAFSRELETGWDVRDTDNLTDISDEPYFKLGVELQF